MKPIIIYIAGSRQHSGKTVTSIGLLSLLSREFPAEQLGYLKPVGQEVVNLSTGKTLDKDAIIIDAFTVVPALEMEIISPVQLPAGFTKGFLASDNQDQYTASLSDKIKNAISFLSNKKIIIAEGTGHPGVGGIVGLSNAQVCNMISADILYISEGGIGKALDKMEVDLCYFKHYNSRVRGILFNKVIPEKVDQTRQYLTEDLINRRFRTVKDIPIHILGFLPRIDRILNPSMNVLRSRFKKHKVIGNPNDKQWKIPLNKIKVISLVAEALHLEKYIEPGDVILIAASSRNRSSRIIRYANRMKSYLGGLILTSGETTTLLPEIETQVKESGIPAILVREDTASAEQIVSNSYTNTKIQIYDEEKVGLIKELFQTHFDFPKFLDTFILGR